MLKEPINLYTFAFDTTHAWPQWRQMARHKLRCIPRYSDTKRGLSLSRDSIPVFLNQMPLHAHLFHRFQSLIEWIALAQSQCASLPEPPPEINTNYKYLFGPCLSIRIPLTVQNRKPRGLITVFSFRPKIHIHLSTDYNSISRWATTFHFHHHPSEGYHSLLAAITSWPGDQATWPG